MNALFSDTLISSVSFYEDMLECFRDERGVWLSVRRVCELLGLDFSSQLSKLKTKSWAAMVTIATPDLRGRPQKTCFILLDCVPLWLATVDVRRVDPAIVPKLTRYQLDCVRVLRDHFFGPSQPAIQSPAPKQELPPPATSSVSAKQTESSATADPILALANLIIENRRTQLAHEARLQAVEGTVHAIGSAVDAIVGRQEQAVLALNSVERTDQPPPVKTTRIKIRDLVNAYCLAQPVLHQDVYKRLYRDVDNRCHINSFRRSKRLGCSRLEAIEQAGHIEACFQIACELFKV